MTLDEQKYKGIIACIDDTDETNPVRFAEAAMAIKMDKVHDKCRLQNRRFKQLYHDILTKEVVS